jgi:hypothetical protein
MLHQGMMCDDLSVKGHFFILKYKYTDSLFPAGRHKSPSMGDSWWERRIGIRTSNDGSSTDTHYSLH